MRIHFKKSGWIFLPVSIWGWLTMFAYIGISIITLVSIDRNYNSLHLSLIRFFPYFISFSVIYHWIGSNSSGKDSQQKQ